MADKPKANKPQQRPDMTAFERWELPTLEDNNVAPDANSVWKLPRDEEDEEEVIPWPTAEEVEAIRQAAHEEGFAKGKDEGYQAGYDQGIKQGQTEIQAELAKLGQIMRSLMEPIEPQEEELEEVLLVLVDKVCRSILKRELSLQSDGVKELIRQALTYIRTGKNRLKIHLHPNDAEQISGFLQTLSDYSPEWKIIPHKSLSPGGCVVETEETTIDATIDTRYQHLIKQMYERELPVEEEEDNEENDIPASGFLDSPLAEDDESNAADPDIQQDTDPAGEGNDRDE